MAIAKKTPKETGELVGSGYLSPATLENAR
jgi:hypothetical protein